MQIEESFYIANAIPQDYNDIHNFFQLDKTQRFGQRRKRATLDDIFFSDYITHRILIRINSTFNKIVGYAEVSNSPNISALPTDLWNDFINFHYYCNLPLNPTNTCFFNTFFYNKDYNPVMLKQLLCEIFYRDNKLKYIVTFECPNYLRFKEKNHRNYYSLVPFSMVFYPKCFSVISCPNTQRMHVVQRDSILTEMTYRKALPEDNDDIVEIVDEEHPDIKAQLGEYYIAEELLSNSKSLLIIAELNHTTAGFIWLNDNIDLLSLLENYVLEPFGNLLKFNVMEKFKEKSLYVTTAYNRPLEQLFTTKFVNEIFRHVGSVRNVENFSNLSLCSNNIQSSDGRIIPLNEKALVYDFVRNKLEELNREIKSYDYYVKIRKRKYGFYYNIPDGATDAPYDTKSNVFVIQLFGLKTSNDRRRNFEFLTAAFAAFPNRDYCLLSVRLADQMPSALLEVLKIFIRVKPRSGCSIKENLFITHRSAVFGDISLFAVRPKDVNNITELFTEKCSTYPPNKRFETNFISSRDNHITTHSLQYNDAYAVSNSQSLEQLLKILKNIFEDPYSPFKCFTIRCGDLSRTIDETTIVGFVIIRPFYNNYFLKKHYHISKIEELQKFTMAELVILKLHPFFHFHADFIFQDLARLTNFSHFYYFFPTEQPYLANDLVTAMQPLEPRRIKKIWFCTFNPTVSHVSENSFENDYVQKYNLNLLNDHIAVFQTNLRPTTYYGNSSNIVILGFNDICKAFLRLMIFSWHNLSPDTQATMNCLPHLNITVICKPGVMEADMEHAFKCEICSQDNQFNCWLNYRNSDAFIRDVRERLDIRTWIQFISGEVKEIDPKNHLIQMESNCEIVYETLLLMCDTDFGVPDRIFNGAATPPNYCHINNRFDKLVFYHKLKLFLIDFPSNFKKTIIVYGSHIRAYEFINFLLKHGIKGSEIHLFMPYKLDILQTELKLNNSTEDGRIEEITREMVEDLGVTIYELLNWRTYTLHEIDGNLKDVTFVKYVTEEKITIECDLFISFYEVYLEDQMVEILNLAKINIDQNFVVVDEKYQTSHSDIYAIGNHIKHKKEPNHQYRFVSPQEAAEKLITVLDLIECHKNVSEMEYKFSKPYYFQAQLPMEYFFIKIICPKRYLANHLDNQYGFPLVTYNNGDFSRVLLNEHGIVEEIVIVTQKIMDFDFLKFFCGRHELMLNNLKSRWYLKGIVSFLDFFQEPWVELLMHDQFENLRMINKMLITETAKKFAEKDIDRDSRRKLMNHYCHDSGITSQVEHALVEFIRKHREDFSTSIALPEDFPQTSNKIEF